MLKGVIRRFMIFGILFILIITSFFNIQAGVSKKDTLPQTTSAENKNVLAEITVKWDSFFHTFNINDLQPTVTINQSEMIEFYFPEINDTIQMNFTVFCKHKLENKVLFPRSTRVYLSITHNDTYLFRHESNNYRCKTLTWEYLNYTVDPHNQLVNLTTHGQNTTLKVEVGIYGFPFGLKGITMFLNDIIVHPVPTPPR
jgi:hypothetical protein